MLELIQETAAYLKGKMHTQPETAIILGTGLGSLATEITEKYEIKYAGGMPGIGNLEEVSPGLP